MTETITEHIRRDLHWVVEQVLVKRPNGQFAVNRIAVAHLVSVLS